MLHGRVKICSISLRPNRVERDARGGEVVLHVLLDLTGVNARQCRPARPAHASRSGINTIPPLLDIAHEAALGGLLLLRRSTFLLDGSRSRRATCFTAITAGSHAITLLKLSGRRRGPK